MTSRSLTQWLQYLETIHPSEVELGLERVASVAMTLGVLDQEQPVVCVAGTNGKGSTIGVMEAVLLAAGKAPGVYTSPHLLRFNERIRVAGEEASDAEIVYALEQVETARGEVSLTYFEFATLAALIIFQQYKPDVVLLEVGLGGRLDAVNIVDADVAVITAIDLDHQEWLGSDRETIAREKAGIMRRDTAVVIGDINPAQGLLSCAKSIGATPVLTLGEDFGYQERGLEWTARLQCREGQLFTVPPQLSGALLPDNICSALQALALLGVELTPELISEGLARVQLPGRRQGLEIAGRRYLLDVAHNPASVDKLLEYININYCNKRIYSVFSVMSDKDVQGIIRAAAGVFAGWFVADLPQMPRAAGAAQLAAQLREEGEEVCATCGDVPEAIRRASERMQAGDCLVIFGSFYTVAAALPVLEVAGGNA